MRFILKYKFLILGLYLIITIIFGFLITKVQINYDATKYLGNDIKTKDALMILDQEFGLNGNADILIKNTTPQEALNIYKDLSMINGVKCIDFDINSELSYLNNNALFKVVFENDNYHNQTKISIKQIEEKLDDYEFYLSGESIEAIKYSEVLQKEIIKIIIILIPIVLIILFLTTTSYIEPFLFIIVILFSVIINMGSNIIFPNISYMTHATCGILQLAICMDYSVILLHSYRTHKPLYDSPTEAMVKATKKSFIPIFSSALTTMGGFTAIMFMKYRIGFDIGIVLTKGTLISLISTFLLMPGLIIMFDKLLLKTKHQNLFKSNLFHHKLILKTKYVIPIFTLLLIMISFFIQRNNKFAYSEIAIVNESKVLSESNEQIRNTFGINNDFMILIPKELSDKEPLLLANIQSLANRENVNLKKVNSITYLNNKLDAISFEYFLRTYQVDDEAINEILQIFNLMKLTLGEETFSLLEFSEFVSTTLLIPVEEKIKLTPLLSVLNQNVDLLVSNHYHRIIFTVDLEIEHINTFFFIDKLNDTINEEISSYYLLGQSVAIYEMKQVVDKDLVNTSILTIIIVFIIILISFKSLFIPFILVLLIQGAIMINMSIPYLTNENLLIIGYIIVSSIQLGSTVDYGILYANRYLDNRLLLSYPKAINQSLNETKMTVLTSGLILIIAGFTLGLVSTIPSIAVFGKLIGRGGLISTILVLFALPQTLLLADKILTQRNQKVN